LWHAQKLTWFNVGRRYISFAEIFTVKAVEGFVDHGLSEDEAWRYATFTFFGGIAMIWALDQVIHTISRYESDHNRKSLEEAKIRADAQESPKEKPDPANVAASVEESSGDHVPPLKTAYPPSTRSAGESSASRSHQGSAPVATGGQDATATEQVPEEVHVQVPDLLNMPA